MTNTHGGARPGAGAPKGTMSPTTRSLRKLSTTSHDILTQLAKTQHPAEFLHEIMQDKANPIEQRIEVAKILLPYMSPKLAARNADAPTAVVIQLPEDAPEMRIVGQMET